MIVESTNSSSVSIWFSVSSSLWSPSYPKYRKVRWKILSILVSILDHRKKLDWLGWLDRRMQYILSVENSANHCLSAGQVTFSTCPPTHRFYFKILAIYEKLPDCRRGFVSYLPAHIIFYPVLGWWTGSVFNTEYMQTFCFQRTSSVFRMWKASRTIGSRFVWLVVLTGMVRICGFPSKKYF